MLQSEGEHKDADYNTIYEQFVQDLFKTWGHYSDEQNDVETSKL